MKPFLNRVTICGADNHTKISELGYLTLKFPFVEWGIVSMKDRVSPGYPDYDWIVNFLEAGLPSSCHLCGEWVKDINEGFWSVFAYHLRFTGFYRFQINFAGGPINTLVLLSLSSIKIKQQVILQLPDFENPVFKFGINQNLNIAGFYDVSHGKGKTQENWPKAPEKAYCGYAGGLNPMNLAENLQDISQVAQAPSWIDVQTGVRTNNKFDLDKVHKFLTIAKDWVI